MEIYDRMAYITFNIYFLVWTTIGVKNGRPALDNTIWFRCAEG